MKNKTYSAAVIGCGRIGLQFSLDCKKLYTSSHAEAYSKNKKIEKLFFCDKDQNKLDSANRTFKPFFCSTNVDDIFKNNKLDIVSISTPPNERVELVKTCIKNNVKAIFIEKPIASSIPAAQEIIDICRKNNCLLAVNHFRRWDSFHKKLIEAISTVGKIQSVNINYCRGIYNTGMHLFDLIRMLFGEVDSVYSLSSINDFDNGSGGAPEPTIRAYLKLKNGLPCYLNSVNGDNYRIFELDVIGSKGRVSLNNYNYFKLYKSSESKYNSEFLELDTDFYEKVTNQLYDYFDNAVNNIINSIERKEKIKCTGEDGIKSLIIARALQQSLLEEREIKIENDQ